MRNLLALLLCLMLVACSGTPKPRMFPPSASLQELVVQPDGRWEVALRVQNLARLGIRISSLDARLTVAGIEAARLTPTIDLPIAASGAERVMLMITPAAGAADAVNLALSQGRSVSYAIEGSLGTSEPGRRSDRFSFASQLSPAPGLPGTLR